MSRNWKSSPTYISDLISEPSTLLQEAIKEFEKSRQEFDQDEFIKQEQALGILANQFVGHENL